jgi:hypothetical protein
MNGMCVVAPTGVLGGGYKVDSLQRAMANRPDFIGCDAGSTDGGPYYLGSGATRFSMAAIRRDLKHMLGAAREVGIPLLIGSAATGGADGPLKEVAALAREIAAAEGLRFRLAVIRSEPPREYIVRKYREGRIRPLTSHSPGITEDVLLRSAHVVAVAGVEPYQAALDSGADVIICGRSSDASIFAAIPNRAGLPAGPVWHAAKILECGAGAVERRRYSDSLVAWIHDDHFIVEPPNPEYRCTPVSVAAHNLYENGSPTELVEPSGTLWTDQAVYEAVSDRAVRVSGSRFVPTSQYTVKLEGAELVGFQSIVIGAVRDPVILDQLDEWLDGAKAGIVNRLGEVFGVNGASGVHLGVRRYGIDGAMGRLEQTRQVGHEVGLVLELTAPTQEEATAAAKAAAHVASHYPVPEWSGLTTTLAFPYSPNTLERGPVYRFTLNHVLELEDPLEPFTVELYEV